MTFSTLASPGVSLQGGGGSGGGGGGTPGGSNTQLQYNSSGTFAGASGLTTNGTELTIASGTKTADAPVLNMSQTWNNGATTFTAIKMNVADTSSASGSMLLDLQTNNTSRLSVSRLGTLSATGSFSSYLAGSAGSPNFWAASNTGTLAFGASLDTFLTRRGAANLRFGAADAAAPVAQTLSVQSVVAGTSNTAGANLTITGSQGTGTGAGGSIIFQVAPAGSSGTAQNALATALTINADRQILASDGTAALPAFSFSTQATTGFYYLGSGNIGVTNNGNLRFAFNGATFAMGPTNSFGWSATNAGAALDTILSRDAANTLALRNGANAQTFRVYSTFTDASNYERGALNAGADFIELAAETAGTGDDNLDVRLTPAGTGNVRFGTHTATSDTAVSGYIEIKDAGGTIRRLAVIS